MIGGGVLLAMNRRNCFFLNEAHLSEDMVKLGLKRTEPVHFYRAEAISCQRTGNFYSGA